MPNLRDLLAMSPESKMQQIPNPKIGLLPVPCTKRVGRFSPSCSLPANRFAHGTYLSDVEPLRPRRIMRPRLCKYGFASLIRFQVTHVEQQSCKSVTSLSRRVIIMRQSWMWLYPIQMFVIRSPILIAQDLQSIGIGFNVVVYT